MSYETRNYEREFDRNFRKEPSCSEVINQRTSSKKSRGDSSLDYSSDWCRNRRLTADQNSVATSSSNSEQWTPNKNSKTFNCLSLADDFYSNSFRSSSRFSPSCTHSRFNHKPFPFPGASVTWPPFSSIRYRVPSMFSPKPASDLSSSGTILTPHSPSASRSFMSCKKNRCDL